MRAGDEAKLASRERRFHNSEWTIEKPSKLGCTWAVCGTCGPTKSTQIIAFERQRKFRLFNHSVLQTVDPAST